MIEEGLKPDDWVITGALLQVRPKMKVDAERTTMPTLLGRAVSGDAATPSPLTATPEKEKEKEKEKVQAKPAPAGKVPDSEGRRP